MDFRTLTVGRTTIRVLCMNSDEQLELRMAGEQPKALIMNNNPVEIWLQPVAKLAAIMNHDTPVVTPMKLEDGDVELASFFRNSLAGGQNVLFPHPPASPDSRSRQHWIDKGS